MASDSFTRSNANPLDGNWTTVSGFNALKLVSNQVEVDTLNSNSIAASTVSTATDSRVTIADVTGGRNGGPALHIVASGGYCLLNYDAGNFYIFTMLGFSTIGFASSLTYQVGDVIGLRRGAGNTLIGSQNGTDVVTSSADTTYTSGVPGIFIYDGLKINAWTDGVTGGGGSTITADAGSYTLTGAAATLRVGRRLTASAGVYTLTGADALRDFSMVAAAGSYALTGAAATLSHGYRLTAAGGSYALIGAAAGLRAGRKIAAAAGSYSLTGADATLTYTPAGADPVLTADGGTYTLTGAAASLVVARKLTAAAGSFALTGAAAGLRAGRSLSAAGGTYSLTGADATLTYETANPVLVAGPGAYQLSGGDAVLTYSSVAAPALVGGGGGRRTMLPIKYAEDAPEVYLKIDTDDEAEILEIVNVLTGVLWVH